MKLYPEESCRKIVRSKKKTKYFGGFRKYIATACIFFFYQYDHKNDDTFTIGLPRCCLIEIGLILNFTGFRKGNNDSDLTMR